MGRRTSAAIGRHYFARRVRRGGKRRASSGRIRLRTRVQRPELSPLGGRGRASILGRGTVPPETLLQPSPEQQAVIAARRADPAGSLRVLAFAGAGKTTALKLLAEADPSPALYLAYNKAAQLQAQARFPAHVACRTVHSLAYRATGWSTNSTGSSAGSPPARSRSCSRSPPSTAYARPSGPTAPSRPCARSPTAPRARSGRSTSLPCRAAPTAPSPSSPGPASSGPTRATHSAVPLEHDAYLKPGTWGARLPPGRR